MRNAGRGNGAGRSGRGRGRAAGHLRRSRRRSGGGSVGSSFSLKPIAITLVLAFLIVLVGIFAIGPFNTSHPLWRLVSGDPAAVEPPAALTIEPEADAPTSGEQSPLESETESAVSDEQDTAVVDNPVESAAVSEPDLDLEPNVELLFDYDIDLGLRFFY